ncbi:hypothetical protein FS837_012083 [Tulasnella sp. UAMH 9824]|nr:hypothetical protein FS837_012083 [Tulasnella sp. UAMH 9824]
MPRFYAVKLGRVPGVYRTWAEASAQTNGFRGSVHCSFSNLNDAVEFSGIPLQQQPGWVRSALGVPDPAVAPATPAAEALHRVSIQSPATPTSMNDSNGVPSSPVTLSRNSGASENRNTRETGNQQAPALTSFFARAAAGASIVPSHHEARNSTPINSSYTSPIHSPSHRTRPIGAQQNSDSWSSHNRSGWIEDSILSGVFHSPAPNANPSSEDATNDTSSNSSTSSDDSLLNPMEPMAGGLYGFPDLHPNHYQIALRTAPRHANHYAPILTSLIGQHAVNYMFLHYYSAGSTVVVANAYAAHQDSARRFVDHMVQVGMPPRQAAYLWTIIAPETIDHPQSEFSYFRWAAVVRALARGGASALQREQGAGLDPNSVSGENDHVEPSDTEQDAVTPGVPSGVNASAEIDEAGGGDSDSGSSGPVEGEGPDYMDIDDDIDDEIEYVDFP